MIQAKAAKTGGAPELAQLYKETWGDTEPDDILAGCEELIQELRQSLGTEKADRYAALRQGRNSKESR